MSKKIEFNPSNVQLQFLQAQEDIVIFGGGAGGGKTFAALLDNLQGIHDPDYFSVFFRSTTTEIDKGLWPEAKKMYEPFLFNSKGKPIGKAKILENTKTITFPSGARTSFSYLERDAHADSWYGSEIAKCYFEEGQYRSYYQFDVLRSRIRTRAKVKPGIRITLNPLNTHFLFDFVKIFLDEDYFPKKELSGKTAYFVIANDVIYTSWDKDQLEIDHGKKAQTYSYIPATVDDNKYIDPTYKDRLDSLSEKKRKQLLLGCWAPIEDSGMYLQKSMFRKAACVPVGSKTVRGWDTAATAPPEGHTVAKGADWTVGIKMSKSVEGDFYIHGIERFQERSGPRDKKIIQTGTRDGDDVTVVMGVDAGAAGKVMYENFAKDCLTAGLICKRDPTPVTQSKLKRAEGFISAVQNGFMYVIESSIEKEVLDHFYNECELFDGERSASHRGKLDDSIDAATSAFNFLNKETVIPSFTLGTNKQTPQTRKSQVLTEAAPTFGTRFN